MNTRGDPYEGEEILREYPYKLPLWLYIACLILFAPGSWFFLNEAIHNNQGLIINNIYLDPGKAPIFYWVMLVMCLSMLILSVLAIYYILTIRTSVIITKNYLILPASIFTRKRQKVRLAHIRQLKMYKVQASRTLEIYVVGGKKYAVADVGLKPDDFNEVVWWLSQAIEQPH